MWRPRWNGVLGNWFPASASIRFAGSSVTNLSRPAEPVPWFYNQRGKAEQYIKEGKNAIK